MKRQFGFRTFTLDILHLAKNSPMTPALSELVREVDFALRTEPNDLPILRENFKALASVPVTGATDPWSEVEYQSIFVRGYDPENRVVLQQPSVRDPMTGVMVLKSARLSGDSGMVYCGKPEQLKLFAEKLPEYEKRGGDLDEEQFLECLKEAAESDGLRVIYDQLSPDHGGEPEDLDE